MENKKHILFISSWFPNRTNPTHGIFNLYFARAVALQNKVSIIHVNSDANLLKDFECVTTNEHEVSGYFVYYKKVTSAIPVLSSLQKRKMVLRAFELAYKQLVKEQGKPDIIHLNVILPMGIGALYLSKKYSIPYVVNENWSGYCEEDGNYKGLFTKYYTQKIVSSASAILPTSDYLKKAMLSHGLKGNYVVIPNVVNVNVFKPSPVIHPPDFTFIHISSLNDREKNVSGIIRAFSEAKKQNQNIKLSVVGEGLDKQKYELLVNELGLADSVSFKGRLLHNDLVNEINRCQALVMFSNYETFCLVIIEAFACGKPVITSNAGAIPDYMKAELGIMVNKTNEQQLKEAILKMANNFNSYDSDYIRNFAKQNYSYEKVGEDLNKIYNSVLLKNQ